jgi:acyl-CoA dehydrogenase family protein 9
VPIENFLGQPGDGFRIAMTVLNYGRIALGAASLGMMRQSLEDMAKRSSTRVQFGTPIKDFPLIQEKLARAKVNTLVSAALNDFTAALMDQNPKANLAIETSHCKLFGTTRAWDTLYDAFQIAGGSAYLATNPYEKRLRDFRVATVFEGTTEIHSIYPALAVLRALSREFRQVVRNPASRFLFFLTSLFRKVDWPLELKDRTLKRASHLARANARTIWRLLVLGLAVYGRKALERQFFLRRITTLSLHLYALLALLARLSAEEKSGLIDGEDLTSLRYFLDEAKESRKMNGRLFDSRRERQTVSVVKSLFP